jgi:hypothetical protein
MPARRRRDPLGPTIVVNRRNLNRRRRNALTALQEALNQLGPITDSTRFPIREPMLDVIGRIYKAGEELQRVDFDLPGIPRGR